MKIEKTLAVIGGDARQIHMINSLSACGFAINYFGLCGDSITPSAVRTDDIQALINTSDVVLCPVPFTKDKVTVFSGYEAAPKCDILQLSNLLTKKHLLISANIPKNVTEMCDYKSVEYVDLNKRDDFCLMNAVATAEGAIAEAVKMSDINLHLSRVLVLGFGRCAQILAKKLRALDSNVCVCARRPAALSAAVAFGYDAFDISRLSQKISDFDFIFNTVPSCILQEPQLKNTKPDAVIIDIASAPGGVDFEYAKNHGIKADLFLGIPGKYSPKSSGIIISDIVKTILIEKGV